MKEEIENCKTEIEKLKNANAQERQEKDKIEKSIEKLKENNKEFADLIGKLEKEKRDLEVEKENLASSVEEKNREYDKFVQKAKQDFLEIEEAKTLQEGFIKCKNFVSGRYQFAEGKVKLPSRENKKAMSVSNGLLESYRTGESQ